MAMPMGMSQMPPPPQQPMPASNPFEKFGGMGAGADPSMAGGMPAPPSIPQMPTPTKRPPVSQQKPAPRTEPTPQEEVQVAESYDQMIAEMINEYRGLFQWQSQWRRY